MKYKPGDVVEQTWRSELGNVIIIRQNEYSNSYEIKYVNKEYNNNKGYGTECNKGTYSFGSIYLGKIVKRKANKPHLPEWL